MDWAGAVPTLGLAAVVAGLFLLHVFRGPKEQDALLRKDYDQLRSELHELRRAHYELESRMNRDFHDKAEVRDMFTQINNRIAEILRHVEPRNGRSGS